MNDGDKFMIGFVLMAFLVLMWIMFIRNFELFVGSGAAASYNSGANLRDQSLATDLYGDYIKEFEKKEGEMIQRRGKGVL